MKRGNKDFLRDILMSAETNCVLKIKIKNVVNPIITAVDKVLENEILLKPTCLYGFAIETPLIQLFEIESVIRYHTNFSHPLFVKMRYIKKNIAAMRNNNEPFHYRTGAT